MYVECPVCMTNDAPPMDCIECKGSICENCALKSGLSSKCPLCQAASPFWTPNRGLRAYLEKEGLYEAAGPERPNKRKREGGSMQAESEKVSSADGYIRDIKRRAMAAGAKQKKEMVTQAEMVAATMARRLENYYVNNQDLFVPPEQMSWLSGSFRKGNEVHTNLYARKKLRNMVRDLLAEKFGPGSEAFVEIFHSDVTKDWGNISSKDSIAFGVKAAIFAE